MNITECIDTLSALLGKDKVLKRGQKYLVDSGLMLLPSRENLPVWLVEIDEKVYLGDYGHCQEVYEDFLQEMPEIEKEVLSLKLADLGIEFDGQTMLMEVGEILDSYNRFVMGIELFQAFCMRP